MTVVKVLVGLFGAAVVVAVWRDVISTVVTTRPKRGLSPARRFYQVSWAIFSKVAARIEDPVARERFLTPYGPVSLVAVLAVWVAMLVIGWGLLWWSLEHRIEGITNVWSAVYFSGVTFLTIGFGDIVPEGSGTRILAVAEGLMGILTTALVIGLLPTLFGAYSRRESKLLTLDDLTDEVDPVEYLKLYAAGGDLGPLNEEFREWDQWCADVYDSHTAYPMLIWFRSRQLGRSWTIGLGIVVESATYVLACVQPGDHRLHHAQLLYRRAVMLFDALRSVEHIAVAPVGQLLSPDDVREQFRRVYDAVVELGLPVRPFEEALEREHVLRMDYIPALVGVNRALLAPLEFRSGVRPIPVSMAPTGDAS